MFDKAFFFHELQKFLLGSEVVLTTINLTWAWRPCGIYLAKKKDEFTMIAGGGGGEEGQQTRDRKPEGGGVGVKKTF